MSLSPAQAAAALSPAPRIACLAAPGSGKTRTLTERAAALIRGGAHPTEVLLLTFTRKACREMRERCKKLGVKSPEIFTFHGWACATLRQWSDVAGLAHGFTIYDEADVGDLARYAGQELKLKHKTPEKLLQSPECRRRVDALLREAQAVDYDGLESGMRRLLEARPELRRRWRHVLVDEGQDTSAGQQELIGMLEPDSLFVVGDPGQSIYGFRGASLEGFLAWGSRSTILTLPTNYRSGRSIVALASDMAAKMQPAGLLQDAAPDAEDGSVERMVWADLAADIATTAATGASCAVLAPRWLSLEEWLAPELEAAGVVHHIARPVQVIWDSQEMRALVAGLRVMANPHDAHSLRIFLRELGPLDFGQWAGVRARSLAEGVSILEAAEKMVPPGIRRVAELGGPICVALDEVSRAMYAGYTTMHLPNRIEKTQDSLSAILATGLDLQDFLDWYSSRAMDGEERETPPGVALSSVHGAKGLEWDAVWILGCDAWKEGEEAKRLLYVAATRAAKRLRMVVGKPEHAREW